jgi:hypothetical protein
MKYGSRPFSFSDLRLFAFITPLCPTKTGEIQASVTHHVEPNRTPFRSRVELRENADMISRTRTMTPMSVPLEAMPLRRRATSPAASPAVVARQPRP